MGIYRAGCSCELALETGELVLISLGKEFDIRIYKMGGLLSLLGIPGETIWKSNNSASKIAKSFNWEIERFTGGRDRGLFFDKKLLLDGIVNKLMDCKSIKEIKERINRE